MCWEELYERASQLANDEDTGISCEKVRIGEEAEDIETNYCGYACEFVVGVTRVIAVETGFITRK